MRTIGVLPMASRMVSQICAARRVRHALNLIAYMNKGRGRPASLVPLALDPA